MTWNYQISDDGTSMDVYDHVGTLVATLQNNGSGFDVPDDILSIMADEIDAAADAGNIDRAVAIARDGSCQQIKRGAP